MDTDRVRRVRLTLFTLDEANRVVEEISPELEELVEARSEFGRIQSRIDVLELTSAGASPDNPDMRELGTLGAQRDTLGERIRQGVERIHRRGCVVKDLDRGLVDFYSLSGDRLIFLCWQRGEKEISYWHSLEGGFSGRQPLPPTDPD